MTIERSFADDADGLAMPLQVASLVVSLHFALLSATATGAAESAVQVAEIDATARLVALLRAEPEPEQGSGRGTGGS